MSYFLSIIKKSILILFIIFFTDILVFFFTPNEIKAGLFVNRAHRIKSYFYHHDFRKNAFFYDQWGYERYKVYTNNLGFKDFKNRKINFKEKNILFIGDSFTEGVGLKFEDTYVGKISNQISSDKILVLNAGVQSYSPKVYYAKLYDIIYRKRYPITHVVLMISGGDVYDDYYKYKEVDERNILLHDDFQNKYIINIINFIKANTFSYQLITRITPPKVIPELISSIFKKEEISKDYNSQEDRFKKISAKQIMKLDFLNRDDYKYLYEEEEFLNWGKDAIINSSIYIEKVGQILKNENIRYDVLYAQDAPLVLIKPINKNLKFLLNNFEKATNKYDGNFYHIEDFTLTYSNSIEAYKDLFYIMDHHYNKKGNLKVAEEILSKIKF